MHFSFIKDLFPQYETDIRIEKNIEIVYIRNRQHDYDIIIHHFPNDHYTYYLEFATQHYHTSSKDDLVEYALSLANAEIAAIEFYKDDKNSFGGEIETKMLENLTYDDLRNYFGYPNLDLTNYIFKVRAWNTRYCFDGYFIKSECGEINIVKKLVK